MFIAGILTVVAGIATVLITSRTPFSDLDIALAVRLTLSAAGYLTLDDDPQRSAWVHDPQGHPGRVDPADLLPDPQPAPCKASAGIFLPDTAAYTLWYATIPDGTPPPSLVGPSLLVWTIALLIPSLVAAKRRDT